MAEKGAKPINHAEGAEVLSLYGRASWHRRGPPNIGMAVASGPMSRIETLSAQMHAGCQKNMRCGRDFYI